MKSIILVITLFFTVTLYSQTGTNDSTRTRDGRPAKEYTLVIEKNLIEVGGVSARAMTINGSVPGPTLEFTEGDWAIIHVENKMDVETSIHWHGLILPNFQDGVPYLNTPPIKAHSTFTYEIPINQSGTYWYHSHTMLQEQKGVYGSIMIQPKEKPTDYDKDLVVVLSDWTDENPDKILKNLKRNNEWYQIKKGTAVPLNRVFARGAFGAQVKMWRDRMEGADIADVYYPVFISNGKKIAEYPDFKAGEKVRLRFINSAASTYFWVDFGGGDPMIVAADGIDVQPVLRKRFLFAIAETYDVIVTIPDGQLEITATSQDGSGHTSIRLGSGKLLPAEVIARPDKIDMMQQMTKMDMNMGAPALASKALQNDPQRLAKKYGMQMKPQDHAMMNQSMDNMKEEKEMKDAMQHQNHQPPAEDHAAMNPSMMMQEAKTTSFDYSEQKQHFNYDFLEAKEPTTMPSGLPVNEMLLNLTGNMNRYVWSLNGTPLTETDKIKIKRGEITRITLNNLTMMHHPMHLHGHFFRVINKNGERSPLKHTVNVAPMQKVTIEFLGEEESDWFFHCHVLYHMMGGMARVFSYGSPRDARLMAYPESKIVKETDEYYTWGTAEIGSQFTGVNLMASTIRNEWRLNAEIGYRKDMEIDADYNRYLTDWVRVYVGVNIENNTPRSFDQFTTVAKAGIKYFTPYMFNVDVSLDHLLRPQVRVTREWMIFYGLFLEGEYEYQGDFGAVNNLENGNTFEGEQEWRVGLEYMLSRDFSIMGSYHNVYGGGGGLVLRF